MSQIAVLGNYDRVILGIFHNGIVASYVNAGIEDIPEQNDYSNLDSMCYMYLKSRCIHTLLCTDALQIQKKSSLPIGKGVRTCQHHRRLCKN